MKRFLLLIVPVLLLHDGITLAQNIEITVLNKNSQPMPYAYILVNNKPVEVSDTMGIAIIPVNILKDNDTISVSYLGASPAWIIYDGSLKENKKHSFHLDESGYNLDEVLVTYQDFEKLFRKSTKSIPGVNYNCMMNAKFELMLSYPDRSGYPASGAFEAANDFSFTPRRYGWFDRSLKFITDNDTATEFGRALSFNTHMALSFINRSLFICQNGTGHITKSFYNYLGEKDTCNVFRISFSQGNKVEFYYQIIIYVKKKTKYIQSVEVEAVNRELGIGNYFYKFNTKFDCEIFTHKKPNKNTIYLPKYVQYTYQLVDNFKIDIKISDISLEYKKF